MTGCLGCQGESIVIFKAIETVLNGKNDASLLIGIPPSEDLVLHPGMRKWRMGGEQLFAYFDNGGLFPEFAMTPFSLKEVRF
jgi:hypothetical protein